MKPHQNNKNESNVNMIFQKKRKQILSKKYLDNDLKRSSNKVEINIETNEASYTKWVQLRKHKHKQTQVANIDRENQLKREEFQRKKSAIYLKKVLCYSCIQFGSQKSWDFEKIRYGYTRLSRYNDYQEGQIFDELTELYLKHRYLAINNGCLQFCSSHIDQEYGLILEKDNMLVFEDK